MPDILAALEADAAALLDRIRRLERRLAREVSAREQAETLLEVKSLELFESNRRLAGINLELEARVRDRTLDLENERRHALELAQRDVLTGLPNRRMFRECLERILQQPEDGVSVGVLYLDLDGFKSVNDTLGHPVGDELLKAVGRRLMSCVRDTEVVARLGGDEFAIILPGLEQPAAATSLADRVVQTLGAPFQVHGHAIRVGTSIGLAFVDGDIRCADELLRNADIALYRAKAGGRNTWRTFHPEMDIEIQTRRAMEADLRRALSEAEFEVFYQPLVDAKQGTVTGYEALLRWQHTVKGLVSPAEFIPLAEEIGLIQAIGAWVLERACTDATAWSPDLRIAINLSPAQFRGDGLVADVERALAASGLAASRLELEITESMLLKDTEITLAILHQLRSIGISISMDDFGTGYSSLSYLQRFPFDKIKIDRSFIRNLAHDRGSLEIVRAVVSIGQALHMKVLAEGVETDEQRLALHAEGCDELQGYLFGRPAPRYDLPNMPSAADHVPQENARGSTLICSAP